MANANVNTPYVAPIVASNSGNTLQISGVAGQSIRVRRYAYKVGGAVAIQWLGTQGTVLSGAKTYSTAGDGESEPDDPDGYYITKPGEGLNLNLSTAVAVGGELKYDLV